MEDKLFNNVGRKIQILAMVLFALCVIGGVIAWLYFITNTYEIKEYTGRYSYEYVKKPLTADDWIGWVCLVGSLFSIIPSWFLYGFGSIVIDLRDLDVNAWRILKKNDNLTAAATVSSATDEKGWKCPRCGEENSLKHGFCKNCGQYRNDA